MRTCVEISLHVNESNTFEGLLYMLEWGILCLSKESIQTGQFMLRLCLAVRSLCPPSIGGEVCWGVWLSLSSWDNQYPTGQHTAAASCSWRTSFLLLHKLTILGSSYKSVGQGGSPKIEFL